MAGRRAYDLLKGAVPCLGVVLRCWWESGLGHGRSDRQASEDGWPRRYLGLSFLLLPDPFVHNLGEVLILAADAFGNLNDNPPSLQFHLLAFVKVPIASPVHVPNEMATVIVDHDALVEGVVFDPAILPSLLLPLEVVGEEADEFEDQCGAGIGGVAGWCSSGPGGHERGHRGWAYRES